MTIRQDEKTTDKRATASRLAFRPDIEGLRGVAVALVVAFHIGLPWVSGGFVGVDVFFVISGYLISGLLIEEHRSTGRVLLLNFYARRIRRLMPAAMLTIVVVLVVGNLLLSPLEMKEVAKSGIAASLSGSNIWFGLQATDYFAADIRANPFLHTWSLAVEEQFYIVWPLLILVVCGALPTRRGLLIAVFVLAVTTFVICVLLTETEQRWAFYGTPFRAWEFAIGAAAYLLRPASDQSPRPYDSVLAAIGIAVVIISAVVITETQSFPGAIAALPVLGTALTLYALAAAPSKGPGRWLASKPMQTIGKLSYSWYLWHWPFLTIGAVYLDDDGDLLPRIGLGLASLLVSAISFRYVEDPIRRNPRLLTRSAYSIILGAVLVGAATAASFGTFFWSDHVMRTDPNQRQILAAVQTVDKSCTGELRNGAAIECVYGVADAPVTIAIMGDSHAQVWLSSPLQTVAQNRGWRLIGMVRPSCPAASATVFNVILNQIDHGCTVWRKAALQRLVELRPDAVILASSDRYVHELEPGEGASEADYGLWQDALTVTATELAAADIPVVLLYDNPRFPIDVPTCLSRAVRRGEPLESACMQRQSQVLDARMAQMRRDIAAGHSRISSLELTRHYCQDGNCPAYRDGLVVYRDNNHLSAAFADRVADSIGAEIERLIAR